jgi:hypothetical protein
LLPDNQGLTLENAAAGSYYMVAISEAGCRFSSPMVEVESLQDLQATITSQTAACNGQATGSIAISVSGGQPPYEYQLGTQPVGQGPGQFALNNLAPGPYEELFITDAGGCELNFSFDIENEPPPQITAMLSPPSCPASSNGQIELEITQLLPPQVNYTVSWSNGSTGNPLQGAAGGTYTATVISENGCEYPAGPFQLQAEEFGLEFNVLSTDASCPEADNGSAIIHPSGGTPPYTYNWGSLPGDPQSNSIEDAIPAGTHLVTVTDANGCSDFATVTVEAQDLFEIDLISEGVDCASGNPDGSISAILTGDNGWSYAYEWSKAGDPGFSATGSTLTGLDIGAYCVTVTDNVSGCQNTACTTLEGMPWPYLKRVVVRTVGTVNETIYDGRWVEDGNGCLIFQGGNTPEFTAAVLSEMQQGNVALEVYARANRVLDFLSVAYPGSGVGGGFFGQPAINFQFAIPSDAVPALVTGGAINQVLQFTGQDVGNRPLMDLSLADGSVCGLLSAQQEGCIWSPAPQHTGSGVDEVHVLQQGCMDIELALEPAINGVVVAQILGGQPPYTNIQWSGLNPGATILDGQMGVKDLAPGRTYCVRITDATGCSAEECIYICRDISDSYTLDFLLPCGNQPESGEICLAVEDGISVEWDNPADGLCWEGLVQPAVYELTLVDLICGQELLVTVPMNSTTAPLSVSVTESTPACEGEADGSLTVAAQGGRPPYQFNWETGATGATANNLISGTCYGLTVTDDCGQQTLTCFEVPAVADLVVQNVEIMAPCINSANGSVVATVSGGRAPFIFRWVNDSNSDWANGGVAITSSPEIDELPEGNYTLTVFEGCGSLVDFSFPIDGVDPPEIFAAPAQVTRSCPDADLGAIDITLNALGQGGSIEWSTGAQTEDVSGLAAGVYTLTVVLEDGCVVEKTFRVREFDPEIILMAVPCASKETGDIDFSFSSNSYHGPYSVSWSNGETWDFTAQPYQNTLSGLAPGIYSATVTSASPACEIVVSEEVSDNDQPVITLVDYMAETDNPLIGGASDGFLEIAVTGSDNYTISWDNGASTSALYEGLSAGWYAVVVTSLETGCSATASFYVESCPRSVVRIEPFPLSVVTPAINGNDGGVNIVVYPYSQSESFDYYWEGPNGPIPDVETSLENLSPGEYCVTVVDGCGRRDEACFQVNLGCPEWTINIETNNQCEKNTPDFRRMIFEDYNTFFNEGGSYEVGDPFVVQWTKNGQVLEESVFEWLGEGDGTGDEISWISGDNNVIIEEGDWGRYYCTITDKYGCSAQYWADFWGWNGDRTFRYLSVWLTEDNGPDGGPGCNWLWDLNPEHFGSVTSMPPFNGESEFSSYIESQPMFAFMYETYHCGLTYDSYGFYAPSFAQNCYDVFCFQPNLLGGMEGNFCQNGGFISAPGYGQFDVLPGYGRKIEFEDKCGCIFPPEAFISSPLILQGSVPVQMHTIPGHNIYAHCPGSCGDEEDSGPPAEDIETCIYYLEDGSCFEIEYTQLNDNSPFVQNCDIISLNFLEFESCDEEQIESKCDGCPADELQFFWCRDVDNGICKVGFYHDFNGNNFFDSDEEILYLREEEDEFGAFCDFWSGHPEYSQVQELCGGNDICYPNTSTLSYDESCEEQGCGCTVEVVCDGQTILAEGEIVVSYSANQYDLYDCPELCFDGYYCMKKIDCDFSGSGYDIGIYNLKSSLSTTTRFIPDGTGVPEYCIPEEPLGAGSQPCLVEYLCDGQPISEPFCHPDCTDYSGDNIVDSGIYSCTDDLPVTYCSPGFAPVVIENRSQGTDSLGRKIVRTDFAIVPDNAFRVSSVFPNPFSQQLTIKLTASYAGNAQVNLVNLLGQVVHTERHEFIRGYTPIQVSTAALGLTPGLYQVVVTDELGNYYTEKIMYQP